VSLTLRSSKPHILKSLDDGIIIGGWPDRIVNGVAIEDKRCGDKLSAVQIACHEWLKRVTGKYPLIHYSDSSEKLHVFRSYKEFYKWRSGSLGSCRFYPNGAQAVERRRLLRLRRKSLSK
jgi:hypothetical protein